MKVNQSWLMAVAAVVGLMAAGARANIIQNGTFTEVTGNAFAPYAFTPNDWTVTPAAMDPDSGLNFGSQNLAPATTPGGPGANFWGFSEPNYVNPVFPDDYDELSQSFATTPGESYHVTFEMDAVVGHVLVYFGPTLEENLMSGYNAWTFYEFNGVATGDVTDLEFYGNSYPDGAAGVADVTANYGVPDGGATAGLMGLAAVGLGVVRRSS